MMADQISYKSSSEPGAKKKKKIKPKSKEELLKKIKADAKNWE